jgi:hypothetical protein
MNGAALTNVSIGYPVPVLQSMFIPFGKGSQGIGNPLANACNFHKFANTSKEFAGGSPVPFTSRKKICHRVANILKPCNKFLEEMGVPKTCKTLSRGMP